jgi:UDP-glucuronate decarboxylase
VRVTYKPLPQDDPTQRQPDITRAREWLGWEPRIPLADGLERTVEYFRQRIERKRRSNRQVALEADGQAAGGD